MDKKGYDPRPLAASARDVCPTCGGEGKRNPRPVPGMRFRYLGKEHLIVDASALARPDQVVTLRWGKTGPCVAYFADAEIWQRDRLVEVIA